MSVSKTCRLLAAVASGALLLGGCMAGINASSRNAASLQFIEAYASTIDVHGPGGPKMYFLDFEFTNTGTAPWIFEGLGSDGRFVVPHHLVSYARRGADGSWHAVKESPVPRLPLRRPRVEIPPGGRAHLVVQWFGEEPLVGDPLHACLAIRKGEDLCSEAFVVSDIQGDP